MADTDNHSDPEGCDLPPEVSCGYGDRLDELRRSLQEAIDETDGAIAKHARYLKVKICEIEAALGASAWRNPFL